MGGERSWSRPARRSRPVRTGLLAAGAGLGLCLVGVAGLGAWNVQVVAGSSGPVREAADGFLREVSAGDVDRAYGRLCADARSRWSAAGFAAWLRTPPQVTGYEITDVAVATRGGRPRGTVAVRLTRDGGGSEQRELPVVRESDGWRVCGDPY
ncbi:hypothetical protein [Micromonospora sp. NPDC001898]|uniref:Rv0361 family membrane protein n=1 Tax=Micromonospora sp. NPDC001898 TaxID=3364221 RepID=UPI003679A1BE